MSKTPEELNTNVADTKYETSVALPQVALIMRSKNEQPYTALALQRLSEQTYTNFTLYNVDSGSTDGTLEAIKAFNLRPENVVEIAPESYVPGRVLNEMIGRTTEPIIVLLNADCVPKGPGWLAKLLRPLVNNTADAVTSRQVARTDAWPVVRYDLARAYGGASKKGSRHCFFSAAACGFKRELWEQESFPEKGWGEDFVWAVRSAQRGARFDIAVDSLVEHSHNYELNTLFKRERGHGIVYYEMLQERPSLLRQGLRCAKHVLRDTIHMSTQGFARSIPYNVAYRTTFHWAHFQGQRAGYKQEGFPQEFFRS